MAPKNKIRIPALAEAIADCLLLVSTSITSYALYDNNVLLGTISVVTGLLGRIVARLFKDEDKDGIIDIFTPPTDRSNGRMDSK